MYIAVEILTIEIHMQALEIFWLLKHQSKSITSLVTLLDLLQRNCIQAILEMIEDEKSRSEEIDNLRHIILACKLKVSPN